MTKQKIKLNYMSLTIQRQKLIKCDRENRKRAISNMQTLPIWNNFFCLLLSVSVPLKVTKIHLYIFFFFYNLCEDI